VVSLNNVFVERAPPKVNLTLRVLGRRPDGYHELESLVAFGLDVADIVTLRLETAVAVTTSGPFAATLAGQNLVAVALAHVAAEAPYLKLGRINLEKNLPIAAGVGGGSADAAAVLRAVQRANPDHAACVDWHALATKLGADVPVCLTASAQVMRGIGEALTPCVGLPPLEAVLVNPQVAVPMDKTALVFGKLGARPLVGAPIPDHNLETTRDRPALLAQIRAIGNDLTTPAREVVPLIDTVLAALSAMADCELVQLSGGGPTCFGVYPNAESAQVAAALIARQHPTWWVRATRLA
jgi:4-diphosphocytidyl-2-C-methyl-D-erythritol kinase